MAITHTRSRLSATGGRYKDFRKKKLFETGRPSSMTRVGETRRKTIRVIGANQKYRVIAAKEVNVFDPKAKKHIKTEIKGVLESEANKNYVRRNILTKGAVIDTAAGKAKITSRPGQDGTVNAILV